jgi:hypothetical protein
MSPYVDAFVFCVVLLFILISLAPFVDVLKDVPDGKKSHRRRDERDAGT